MLGQGAGDKAVEDVPDDEGTRTAIRLSERGDSTTARGPGQAPARQRSRIGVLLEGFLVEQDEVVGVVEHLTQVLIRYA